MCFDQLILFKSFLLTFFNFKIIMSFKNLMDSRAGESNVTCLGFPRRLHLVPGLIVHDELLGSIGVHLHMVICRVGNY